MREVEVKYRVTDLEALLVALKACGIGLSEPVHQDDQAYAPVGWEFGESKLGVSFLRLRIATLRLTNDELDAYEFCDEGQVKERLRPYVWRRISVALEALTTGRVRYLQDGYA